jgi:hypothetical protein
MKEFSLNNVSIEINDKASHLELVEHRACNQLSYHYPQDYKELYSLMKSKNIKQIVVGSENLNKVIDLIIGNKIGIVLHATKVS